MKRIGILTCLHAGEICTGASCLRAFAERKYFFEGYGEDTQLLAFMKCNGCAEDGAAKTQESWKRWSGWSRRASRRCM